MISVFGTCQQLPPLHAMFIWPDIDEEDRQAEEDDPKGQQHQHAVADGHHTLVVTVAICDW